MGLGVRIYTDLPGQLQCSEAAGNGDGLMAVSVDDGGGKTLAMLLRQLCINRLPLGLQKTPEDSVTCGVGRSFQVIKGSIWLERRDIGPWELEGGKLSHLIG